MIKIGVLALQGAVYEHIKMVKKCGYDAIAVKKADQLDRIDRLIIPGGESTVMGQLMEKYHLNIKIQELGRFGMPIFGTCAGMILLAKRDDKIPYSLNLINIKVKRNAYGRQVNSFEADITIKSLGFPNFKGVFIRAPSIISMGKNVKVLACLDGKKVLVREKNILVSSFHPELSQDSRLHQFFIHKIGNNSK